jgi:hypothetical protein
MKVFRTLNFGVRNEQVEHYMQIIMVYLNTMPVAQLIGR